MSIWGPKRPISVSYELNWAIEVCLDWGTKKLPKMVKMLKMTYFGLEMT